ncbi:interferon alpha/beta receptor 1a-like isoform X2 [Acipenser ruthenus]|uniref:interferon alpha/beta receptor 1a-like isoform X2 n=1 Tax=Acipenser ruthenus TaxID=7906 RepID=UPI0027412F4D|nr:interferon alpha/beta receptor 1a-like isoform X2 [Acipenser ruthenus]
MMSVIRTSASLLVVILIHIYTVTAKLPEPQNVKVQGVNTRYILKWDWEWDQQQANKSVRFTVEYIPYKYEMKGKKEWRMVCEKIPGTQCDFSEKVNYFGMFHLRLRAKSGRETSPWVIIEFCAEKDADLGPPSKVNVISKKGMLEVIIADPMTSENKSMRELQKIYFMVVYWKNTSGAKNVSLIEEKNVAILMGLEPWTVYCVQVQSLSDYYEKKSLFSPMVCTQTTDDGHTPLGLIILIFFFTLALSFGGTLLCSFIVFQTYRVIKYTFFPFYQLPDNIQECLNEFTPMAQYSVLLSKDKEIELCCEKVDIVSEVTHEHSPISETALETDPVNHCRQNSGDSGVYSSEDGSGGVDGTGAPPETAGEE